VTTWGGFGEDRRRALPTIGRSQLDEREEWIRQNAAGARQALASQAVRAELLALLGANDAAQRRERRLAKARRDLASLELRMKLAEEEPWI
jgi:phosphohistidine phosphatase SixA